MKETIVEYVLVYRDNKITAIKDEKDENVTATEIYPSLYGIFDEVETSIDNVDSDNQEAIIYDLTGRRIDEIVKPGIYIVGGKKVLVK
jgi:hypothetical protein